MVNIFSRLKIYRIKLTQGCSSRADDVLFGKRLAKISPLEMAHDV